MEKDLFPRLGFGLGLRSDHYSDILSGRPTVSWFEVVTENYLKDGGRPLKLLEKVRESFPLVFHGVSLSLGSTDPFNVDYLNRLKLAIDRFQPTLVSDHCCWVGVHGESLHDLLPLPFTEEALAHMVQRIQQVQDYLGRRILIENVSSYLTYTHSEMSEWEFLSEICKKADCGLLLDVNNIYVNSVNHGFDPIDFVLGVPTHRVGQIHLAGHSVETHPDGSQFLIDTHDHPVCPEVWDLYGKTLQYHGPINTMVEWDANIPTYSDLEAEVGKARRIEEAILGRTENQSDIERTSGLGSSQSYAISTA